jgi:hypothetical protein
MNIFQTWIIKSCPICDKPITFTEDETSYHCLSFGYWHFAASGLTPLTDNYLWVKIQIDGVIYMYEQECNYPSIYMWSKGNPFGMKPIIELGVDAEFSFEKISCQSIIDLLFNVASSRILI